ncbi:hypothetical protein BC938DRAFT_473076 [Jimgerdemannia flammicorona]|uniref:Uncharacterized protein n=1 Tax=Jimgerdemannia flammicorona TaxID=994334 RepID=A0A433Q4N4_9FUNG|nr:hypothetical protein BC938DRAFT_473076 [Jimgerdemannia flammicorona]
MDVNGVFVKDTDHTFFCKDLSLSRQTCTLLNQSFRQREDLEQWYEDNKDGIARSDFSVIDYQPITLHEAEKRASEDEKPVYSTTNGKVLTAGNKMKCTAFGTVCDKLFGRTVDEMLEIAPSPDSGRQHWHSVQHNPAHGAR